MPVYVPQEVKPHPLGMGGTQELYRFANGYGASVVRFPGSYGWPDLWELAVLRDGHLCYDTPITDDVLGRLTREEVTAALTQIEELPA